MNNKCGVVTALLAEARTLTTQAVKQTIVELNHTTLLYVSGMGAENAATATKQLIDAGCDHIISWGCCAGLSNNIQTGDIIIPDSVTDQHTTLELEPALFQTPDDQQYSIHRGTLAHTEHILNTSEQKQDLHSKTRAIAADMESFVIAKTAHDNTINCTIIRSVSDIAAMTIPADLHKHVNEFGEARLIKIISGLLLRPTQLPQLIQLGNGFSKATNSLRAIAPAIFSKQP